MYSNSSVSAKFFPMLVKTPYFGGVINQKTYLNHELDSKFFSSVVWLINSEVIGFWRKNHVKWARTDFFLLQLLVWDSTFPTNLKSVLVYIVQ